MKENTTVDEIQDIDHPDADSNLIFMSDYKHDPLARGNGCFCDRCETISYHYKLRKMERARLEEKHSDSCIYLDYIETRIVDGKPTEVPLRSHEREACVRTPQTFCSEWEIAQNAWTIFLAELDIEAFAWRKLVDSKLQSSNYTIDGLNVLHEYEQQIKKNGEGVGTKTVSKTYKLHDLLDSEIERLRRKVSNLRKDRYYSNYSVGKVDYVSPFADLVAVAK